MLRQVAAMGGISSLDDSKKEIFFSALSLMSSLLKNTHEITNVSINADYSLTITAQKEILSELKKLEESSIIQKIE